MKTSIARAVLLPRSAGAVAVKTCRHLHTRSVLFATPIPHPATPGPPPKPPVPSALAPEGRLDRKRKQAELLQLGQNLRAHTPQGSTSLSKRFWKNVSIKETPDGYQIMLDARPVRTPSKANQGVLVVPLSKPHLATAIALEWDLLVSAHQALKHHYIPMTSLVARAIDIQVADAASRTDIRDSIVKMLMDYLRTDTLLCWEPEKSFYEGLQDDKSQGHAKLRQLQMHTAAPILDVLTSDVWKGVELKPILSEDSILPSEQPEKTTQVIKDWVSKLPAFELAAVERGVLASKSLLVAVRLVVDWSSELAHARPQPLDRPRFTIEDAAEASSLEVSWQTGMWGEVEDTHDVDKEDLRRQLGSVVLLVQSSLR